MSSIILNIDVALSLFDIANMSKIILFYCERTFWTMLFKWEKEEFDIHFRVRRLLFFFSFFSVIIVVVFVPLL